VFTDISGIISLLWIKVSKLRFIQYQTGNIKKLILFIIHPFIVTDLVKVTNMTDKVPSYDEFNEKFPSIASFNVAVNLTNYGPCTSIGTTNRANQLLTSQLLLSLSVRRVNFGVYQQPTTNSANNNVINIPTILRAVRAVIGTSTDTRFGETGLGLILPGTIVTDKVLTPDDVGVYLSNRTETSTFDVQALQKGCTINMTTKLTGDVYVGSSYSNIMDSGRHSKTVFLSRLPTLINPELPVLDGIVNNSKLLLSVNVTNSYEKGNQKVIVGQTSTPFQTRFGDATILTGTSIDMIDKSRSTVTLSGKHAIGDTGLALLSSLDLSPFKRNIDAGMLGIEYSPSSMPKLGNIGLYGEFTNTPNGFEFTPKFGLNLKF